MQEKRKVRKPREYRGAGEESSERKNLSYSAIFSLIPPWARAGVGMKLKF